MPYGDFPPNVVETIQRQISQFGRVGATKFYVAPLLTAAIPAAASAAAPSVSDPVNIRFREPGTVIAMYGQELSGTVAKFAKTWLRVQIGGQEELFRDDQKGVWLPMLALFGPNQNWTPLWRRAIPGVDWTVLYENYDTAATAFPTFVLAFIADADLARDGVPQ
jgi:hypothetical protein